MTTEEKLRSAIERLTVIEKYLTGLINENVVKHALLILAASRCRGAKDAIASHLERNCGAMKGSGEK